MIGLVQLHTKDTLNNNCKIGYIISYKYNNRGYGKEAVTKVIDFVFNKLKFHRIDANIVVENEASIKLAESIGMHFESEREDSYNLRENYYNQKVYTII